jgi:AcrR family transcriptional regulator
VPRTKTFPVEGEERSPAAVLGRRAIRTRSLILDTARELFLRKGYGGTRIDDIAEAAEISRASFYTYFPSKRDVLLAIGTNAYVAANSAIESMKEIPTDWDDDDIGAWVDRYLDFMDGDGAFIAVWAQATPSDEDLRKHGVQAELRAGRRLGSHIERLRNGSGEEPAREGLVVMAMIHQFWYLWRVTGIPMSRKEVLETLTRAISALIRGGGGGHT